MATSKQRLVMTLAGAGVPVDTVTITGPTSAAITYMTWATPAQIQAGAAIIAAYDWSDTAETAWQAMQNRPAAVALLGLTDAQFMLIRAVVSAAIGSDNTIRDWLMSFQAAVAASTSLADLKTRVTALAALPDLTLAQARATVVSALNSGTVDS